VNGKIWSIQYIHEDGTKRFAKDGRKEGCFHVIGGMGGLANAKAIIIAEGYATAASIAEALKMPVVVAFDSGNLPHVAKALHEKFPQKPIIIAGDDDWHLEQTQGFNPGRLKAEEAAKAVGGQCVFPAFAPEDIKNNPKAFTDFNDLITKSSRPGKAIEQQIGQLLPQKKSLNNHKRANA
jgi:putative DNA primase/helicase